MVGVSLMNAEKYGKKYKDHLLDQYKVYVKIMNQTSIQRGNNNKFYIATLSLLLAMLSFFINFGFSNIIIFVIALIGLLLCYTWQKNIESYRQLNAGRFRVIHEMEKQLPFNCFEREWQHLTADNYTRLTKVEKYIPLFLSIPYIIIVLYYFIEFFSYLGTDFLLI